MNEHVSKCGDVVRAYVVGGDSRGSREGPCSSCYDGQQGVGFSRVSSNRLGQHETHRQVVSNQSEIRLAGDG